MVILEHVAGNLGNEALIVTRDDEVFALGSNGAGCLGQGDMHSTLHPKQVEPLCYKVSSQNLLL
jgi:RCC1 and BTB domain-containing protein